MKILLEETHKLNERFQIGHTYLDKSWNVTWKRVSSEIYFKIYNKYPQSAWAVFSSSTDYHGSGYYFTVWGLRDAEYPSIMWEKQVDPVDGSIEEDWWRAL